MNPNTYKHGYPVDRYTLVPMASGAPFQRNPTTSDVYDSRAGGNYQIGTIWPNAATGAVWILSQISSGVPSWLGITDAATGNLDGPASSTDKAIVRFNGTTGKLAQDSGVTIADTTNVMTFPAGAGIVYTTGSRKGSFTLAAGTHAQIATTAAVTGCLIVYTVVTLGTVIVASSFLTTIANGVGFTPVASQNTDTSTVNWAIVA